MNVLKLTQDVANKFGVTPPTTLYGSLEPIAIRMIALLEDECRFLRNKRCWPQQKKEATITTSSGRDKYPLPSDFYAWIPGTEYDRSLTAKLQGPLSDSEFNERLYGITTNNRTAYRIFGPDANPASSGGQFQSNPTPTTIFTIKFNYCTEYMFYNSTYTTGSETIASDTDVCLFDDDIVLKGVEWRYRESKGQAYAEQQKEHSDMVDSAVARWQSTFRGNFNGAAARSRYTVPPGGWSL